MHYISVLNGTTDFEESKTRLEHLGLVVKEYDNLYLVKYDKTRSNMEHEDVLKCRGIILEKNTNRLVCISPPKSLPVDFYHKKYLDKNSEGVLIEEFYDGTMINVFRYNDTNYISTRSCLGAHNKYRSIKTFKTLFSECIDFDVFEKLSSGYCYSFLLQHPDNKIVKQYDRPSNVLVMTTKINQDNSVKILNPEETLKLLQSSNVELSTPRRFEIDSMESIYNELDNLNESDQGFVLKYYDNGSDNRSKIRNLKYNDIRKLRGNDTNKMFMYFELRKKNNVVEYLEYFPEDKELFDKFRFELYDFTSKLFKYYLELKIKKNIKFLEIDFEYRPMINDLHEIYVSSNKQITKNTVIRYLHNLDSARILFALNYSKKSKNTNRNVYSTSPNSKPEQMLSMKEYPVLKN